ncbi:hypothetical protein D9M72_636720 [compost metagenome]
MLMVMPRSLSPTLPSRAIRNSRCSAKSSFQLLKRSMRSAAFNVWSVMASTRNMLEEGRVRRGGDQAIQLLVEMQDRNRSAGHFHRGGELSDPDILGGNAARF